MKTKAIRNMLGNLYRGSRTNSENIGSFLSFLSLSKEIQGNAKSPTNTHKFSFNGQPRWK